MSELADGLPSQRAGLQKRITPPRLQHNTMPFQRQLAQRDSLV